MTPILDDNELLERARRLDQQALGEIHDRYYSEVYRYVRYRLAHEQLCEDITSEVFLRFLDCPQPQRGAKHQPARLADWHGFSYGE